MDMWGAKQQKFSFLKYSGNYNFYYIKSPKHGYANAYPAYPVPPPLFSVLSATSFGVPTKKQQFKNARVLSCSVEKSKTAGIQVTHILKQNFIQMTFFHIFTRDLAREQVYTLKFIFFIFIDISSKSCQFALENVIHSANQYYQGPRNRGARGGGQLPPQNFRFY